MADEPKQRAEQDNEPEVRRPDEAIKDLEPEKEDGDAVKGGSTSNYIKYQV